MDIDRKTQRELNRLSADTQRLWDEQREVLSHAKTIVREASRNAGDIARREVLPRAQSSYRDTLEPLLTKIPWSKAPAPQKTRNPLGFVLMAIGTLAVAAIGLAAYQALRADEDLWVEEDAGS